MILLYSSQKEYQGPRINYQFTFAALQYESKYLVDFDPLLTEIITETKYMEQLGFSVPELARNVTLQVKYPYFKF